MKRILLTLSIAVAMCLQAIGASTEESSKQHQSYPIKMEHLNKLKQALEDVHSSMPTKEASSGAYSIAQLQLDLLALQGFQYETFKEIELQYYSNAGTAHQGYYNKMLNYNKKIAEALQSFIVLSRKEYEFQLPTDTLKEKNLATHLTMVKGLAINMQQVMANAFSKLLTNCVNWLEEIFKEEGDCTEKWGVQANQMVDIFAQVIPVLHRSSELIGKLQPTSTNDEPLGPANQAILQPTSTNDESLGPANQAIRYHDFMRRELWGNIKYLVYHITKNGHFAEADGSVLKACATAVNNLIGVDITKEYGGISNDYSEYRMEEGKQFDLYTQRYLLPLVEKRPNPEPDPDAPNCLIIDNNIQEIEDALESSKNMVENMMIAGTKIDILARFKESLAEQNQEKEKEAMPACLKQEAEKLRAVREKVKQNKAGLTQPVSGKVMLHLYKLESFLEVRSLSLKGKYGKIDTSILDQISSDGNSLNIGDDKALQILCTTIEKYEVWKKLYNEKYSGNDWLRIDTEPAPTS